MAPMALEKSIIRLLIQMRQEKLIGAGATPSLLEFGEQNWYGDVNPAEVHALVERFCAGDAEAPAMHAELDRCIGAREPQWLFRVAKIFYRALLEFREYVAIDLHGTAAATAHDLNAPLALGRQFHFVTNLGTGEHVFNQYQFFRSLHEHTLPGGLMLHSLPNQGAFDHGFYNYHPTFVFDLCQANAYQMLACLLVDAGQSTQLARREDYARLAVKGGVTAGRHTGLLVLMRKPQREAPFRAPQQGFYDNRLSPEVRDAWLKVSRG
jgi:hypothetical protein